jgi:hypothetical protein
MTTFETTLPSIASRKIPLRGKFSFRGAIAAKINGRRRSIVYESRLELKVSYIVLSKKGIVDLIDQPPPVSYIDFDGKSRTHTFDYLAIADDGKRFAVAVKPNAKVDTLEFRRTLQLIRAQWGDYADDLLLITESSFTAAEADNAELFFHIGGEVDDEADQTMMSLIDSLNATCSIGALVKASGLEGRAFRSIVRLIAHHRCRHVGRERISYATLVAQNATDIP